MVRHYSMAPPRAKRKRIMGTPTRTPRLQTFYGNAPNGDGPVNTQIQMARSFLYFWPIVFRRASDGALNQVGEGIGRRIHLKGLKICVYMRNFSTELRENHMLHMAIIQPKTDQDPTSFDLSKKFFSVPGGGPTTQGDDPTVMDFPTGNTTWDPRLNCNGINPRKFNIITHKKFRLDPKGPATAEANHLRQHEQYFKVGKTFEYRTPSNAGPGNGSLVKRPLYVCFWYEYIMPPPGTQDPQIGPKIDVSWNTVTYFKSII